MLAREVTGGVVRRRSAWSISKENRREELEAAGIHSFFQEVFYKG